MKYSINLLILYAALMTSCNDSNESNPPCDATTFLFQEESGILVIEAEELPEATDLKDWNISNTKLKQQDGSDFPSSFNGDGYIVYNGEEFFREGGNSPLTYEINVTNTGIYRFVYASAITLYAQDAAPNTEHNDVWIKFPDADAFYGYRAQNNSIAIPKAPNQEDANPNDPILEATYPDASYKFPNGANEQNNGYFKVYMNQLNDWWYEGSTSDSNAHNIYVRFDNPGTYTLEISGRSTGFAIDRIILYKEEGALADLNRNERKEQLSLLISADAECL